MPLSPQWMPSIWLSARCLSCETSVVHQQVPGYTENGSLYLIRGEGHRGFADNMADAVTDQDLDGDLRIILFLIRKVDKSTGNAVSHLVGMRRVYFFKHISFLSER